MLSIPADDYAEHSRARLALLGGELVKPFDIFIGQIGEDASHDILISYHDIMSRGKMPQHFRLKEFDHFRVHKFIVVWNVQNDKPF